MFKYLQVHLLSRMQQALAMERHPINFVYFLSDKNKDETLHEFINQPYPYPEEGYCRRFETIMVPYVNW